jgi:hypothetical protein
MLKVHGTPLNDRLGGWAAGNTAQFRSFHDLDAFLTGANRNPGHLPADNKLSQRRRQVVIR